MFWPRRVEEVSREKMHKYIYIGLCAVIVVLSGILYGSGRTDGEMDRVIAELTAENARIASDLSAATDKIGQLNLEITELRAELEDFNVGFESVKSGLSEIGEGIQGVLSEMLAYGEKTEPAD